MNLVQINERLKDLPMQVIQQYANGMNPEVPPYLALGELQRREMAQKQMANTQGAAQGPQPSIKEQVEQKAGLMQLQQMQQQQMQQMQQPRGPMPVPAGVPQPQMQPEMAMARGGLAGIPVRRDMFEYASGGIIAFAEGGQPNGRGQATGFDGTTGSAVVNPAAAIRPKFETRFDAMTRRNRGELTPEERAEADAKKPRVINLPKGTSRQEAEMVQMQNPDAQVVVEGQGDVLKDLISRFQAGQEGVKKGLAEAFTYSSDIEAAKKRREPPVSAPAPQAPPVRRMSPPEVAKMLQDPYATGAPAAPEKLSVERDPATNMPMVDAAPAAMPPAVSTGLPHAMKVQSPLMDEALAMARDKPTAPTAEGIIAEQQKLMPAGMQDEARQKMLADQRARAEERKATFERTKPSGLDDLIRVFGQSGQFKGGTGMAPAYTANQDRKRAQELAFQKEQDELLTAIDTRSSAFDSEVFGSREKSMTAATKAYLDRLLGNTKALADLAGVDQRRMDEAAGRLTQMQIAKLREATANKPTEAERIEANYMALIAKEKPEEAEAYLNRISRIKGGGTAGVGSARNRIMERRQEMQELSVMAKNELGQFSDEDVKFAVDRIAKLARENAKDDGEEAPKGIPLPEDATVKNLTVGTVYQTARGPAKWTGTAFAPI